MAGLFDPKRVQVPGILSDQGLAVQLRTFGEQQIKQNKAAPPPDSAVDFSNAVAAEALKPQPGMRLPPARTSGVELSAGERSTKQGKDMAAAVQSIPGISQISEAIVGAGTLTPEQQVSEQQAIIDEMKQEEQTVKDAQALGQDMQTARFGEPPDWQNLTPEQLKFEQERVKAQLLKPALEARANVLEAETTLPTQAWWLNFGQVATRSAAQMGVGTLRAPLDFWDTAAAIAAGEEEVTKSEFSVWMDGVDKALTNMLPGDKARSKQFVTELAGGTGSMVGFLITGWVGRAVGLPAGVTTGIVGASAEADAMYQDADGFSATATQKMIALFLGAGLGATEAIPIDRAFMRADVATGGAIRNLLANTSATSLEEFIQEASQTIGEDLIAKYGAGYDPNREVDLFKAAEAGLIGAITGAAAGAATTMLPNGQEMDPIALDETQQTEMVDAALDAEAARFDALFTGEDVGSDGQDGVAAADGSTGASPTGGSAATVARPAPVVADAVRGDAVQSIIENQAAFHGTPHKFDKFSMEKIGTGEGAQAFGHGLYFAGNRSVAEGYRRTLSANKDTQTAIASGTFNADPKLRAATAARAVGEDQARQNFENTIANVAPGTGPYTRASEALQALNDGSYKEVTFNEGALYQVDIPDDAELLDWDAPLSAQPQAVQDKLRAAGLPDDWSPREGEALGRDIYEGFFGGAQGYDPAGASRRLAEAGIAGLRYLDAGSRTQGDGTRNYVIFDDSRITITDVEAQQADLVTPDTMVAAADPAPNLAPLPGATGAPQPSAVKAVMAYAAAVDFPITRQTEVRPVTPAAQGSLADLYTDMPHQPDDPAVLSSYNALVEEVRAQYAFAVAANGGDLPAFAGAPQYPADHPLAPVAEQFWSLYQFFGTGLEGATDPENMWQAHARVFSASARPAFTTETRGPQAWETVRGEPAERKVGLMRSTAWEYDLDREQIERMEVMAPRAQTETAAFKKWFGDSKVVDAEGRPLVVYHGSPNPAVGARGFAFRIGATEGRRTDFGNFGDGVYMTPQKFIADVYARGNQGRGAFGATLPLYVSIQNPIRITVAGGEYTDEVTALGKKLGVTAIPEWRGSGQHNPEWSRQFRAKALAAGYDGVITQNIDGSMGSEVVAFDPTQIKSAIANVGTFDPSDPAIDRMTGTATVRQPFMAEPTRPTKGIPTPSPAPAPNEDVRLSKISSNFVKLLDLTARHGRLAGSREVMGEYHRRSATIRMRTWTDFSTLVHEGGHAINDSMAAPLNAFVSRHVQQIATIARTFYAGDLSKATSETIRREGFAEFFRTYVTNPSFARNRWPDLVDDFEQTLRAEDPKVLDGLGSISAQFQAWVNLPSRQLIRNMVVDGRRAAGVNAAVKELKDQGFKTWMAEYARRMTTATLNKYAPVAELEAQLLNLGEQNQGRAIDLARADSPTAILRLARNAGSRAQVEITDGVIGYRSTQTISRGLREAMMTALGVDPGTTPGSLDEELLKDFDAYLIARRAFDEYRRFEAGEIDRPPIGAQKGDVVRTIKEYEKTQPQFAAAARIVHEYGMAMWQKRYDAGLMDKDTYEEGLQRQFYAPLQRDVSDKQGTGADSIGFGKSVLTQGPRFRGSDRDIISPMTVLMQMTHALEKQIAENDAKRALALLADRAGQAGALVERIPASQLIGQSFSVQQVGQRLTADANLSAADAADLLTILAGSVEKGDMMTLFRSEQAGTQGENVLFFWENGKVAAIRLNETSLAADVVNTMNAVGRENMDILLEGVAATSSVYRSAITKWPDFLLVNYVRDQFSAWILGGTNYVPFATGIRGIGDEIRQKQWAKSYNAAGGILGGMNTAALHATRVDRDIRALRATGYVANVFGDMNGGWSNIPGAIKGFARFTEITETGTRLGLYRGAYERARRDGLSEYDASVEAAYIATDYIDFGLNGSRMLHARRLVPFLNAQLQGLYKMFRTLSGDEVARRKGLTFALGAYFKNINNLPLSRLEKQQLRTGRSAWLKMMSLGLISAALYFVFRDDPDYQETSEYLRVSNWIIPMGDGRIFVIPKPFELAIVANAVERGLEVSSGDPTAVDRFLRGVGLSMIPPTAPPSIQSIVEVAANYDFFTGRAIVPEYSRALDPALQYDNYTSSLAKWIGGATGQSPLVVDHILSGLGASAYRDVSTMLNAADPNRPTPDETEWPIIRRFVRDSRRGATGAQDFWAQASTTGGKLSRAAATYKRYKDMGNEPAANRWLDTLDADQRAYAVLMTDFTAEEKRLNPFYRARQVTTVVSGMRRENSSELGLGDTTSEPIEGEPLAVHELPRGIRTQVDDILSEISRREVRNTMIATGQPGWRDKEVLPLEPTLDMLLAVAPDVYDEYQRRYAKAKIYDAQSVYDYWPDVRDRLVSDGPDAILTDAVAVAKVVF
jgi:hypothetical protein